jgi:hypothetical protein
MSSRSSCTRLPPISASVMDRPDFAPGSSQAIDVAHLQGRACTMTIGIVRWLPRRTPARAAARTSWMRMCQIRSQNPIRDQSAKFAIDRNSRYGSKGREKGFADVST